MNNFRFNSVDKSTVSRSLPNGGFHSCTVADPEYIAWCEAGNAPEPYVPPALTNNDFLAATQSRLDALAVSWNYDSMLSLVTYIDSLIPRFKTEATVGRDFRDATWLAVVNIQSAVMGGTLPIPATIADYLALLPSIPARPVIA